MVLDGLLGILPKYAIGGLLFSWLVWGYFFSEDKKLKLQFKATEIVDILRIFLTLFFGVSGLIYVFALAYLVLYRANIQVAIDYLNNFSNNIFLFFIVLTFFFVICVNNKLKKSHLRDLTFNILLAAVSLPLILFGISLSSHYSNYRDLVSGIFFGIALLSSVMLLGIFALTTLVFNLEPKKAIKKYLLKNINTKLFFLIVSLLSLICSFLIFYWCFPQITEHHRDVSYFASSDYQIYLQREMLYDVNDIGSNNIISNWIVLKYTDTNFSDVYSLNIGGDSALKIHYKNSSDTNIPLSELFTGSRKDILIENNVNNNMLILRTNNDYFRKDIVRNISLNWYTQITPIYRSNIIITNCNENKNGIHSLTCNIKNNSTLPVLLSNFFVQNLQGYGNDTICNLRNMTAYVVYKNGTRHSFDTPCSDNSCSNLNSQHLDEVIFDLSNLGKNNLNLRLDVRRKLDFDIIRFSLNATC